MGSSEAVLTSWDAGGPYFLPGRQVSTTSRILLPVGDAARAFAQAIDVAGLSTAEETGTGSVLDVLPHQHYAGAPEHDFTEIPVAVEAADLLADAGVPVERAPVGGGGRSNDAGGGRRTRWGSHRDGWSEPK